MRRRLKLRYLTAALAVAGFAWAAAPAISADPYLPPAVDFEQRLGQVSRIGEGPAAKRSTPHGAEGRVSFRSGVIEAPHRFDLVGLAGEVRELELRARASGEEWSGWVDTTNGDPVWFGGADELQLRTRGGWRPTGRLHYVNVSGTTSGAETLLTRFRQGVSSAFVAAAGLVEPEAAAAPARPEIVTRAQWGAARSKGGCTPRTRPVRGRVKAAVVHHTVTASDYTRTEAPSVVLGICRYHRNANGWNDIGYNALVDRFGTLYAGRAGGLRKAVVGAHAQGFNAQTTGIASIGTHTTTGMTPATLDATVRYLAWKLSAHRIRPVGKVRLTSAGGSASRYPAGKRVRLKRIIGHRDVGKTACPGNGLYAQLAQIRRQVRALTGGAEGGTTPEPTEPVPVPPPPEGGEAPILPAP